MEFRYLVTGSNGGVGRFLCEHLPNCKGLVRGRYAEVKDAHYDIVIHCAFNKSRFITDDRQYLEDNVLLTQRLLQEIDFRAIVYLSSVDIYTEPPSPYALCKRFGEALVRDCEYHTNLRCATLLGPYMKGNHVNRLRANEPRIGLSGKSSFNYILYQDLLDYFTLAEVERHWGETVDFVATENLPLAQTKAAIGSTTQLGDAVYTAKEDYERPLFAANAHFRKSSLDNLQRFLLTAGPALECRTGSALA